MKIYITLFAIVLILQTIINGSAGSGNPQGCFSDLAKLPNEKIQDIYYLKIDKAALTQPASDTLSCYLRESHIGDKSINLQLLEVYKKIDEYKRNNVPFGDKQLKELESLGLPYTLKDLLSSKIKAGDTKQVKHELDNVQTKVGTEIELSHEYEDFRKNIFAKYN